jgi:hypothetical protein
MSVEAYLTDAGFSPTELLILKNLLQVEGLSLRQLASKTGKSTGVLDQAMKKLLRKKIVSIRTVNDAPLYMLDSLESVVRWMEKDTAEKRAALEQRYQDFESFISSVQQSRGRPEVEQFTGEDGIKRAYCKMLDTGSKELLQIAPITCKEEEDPLRDFKVQYFRERHRRKIFLRVLGQCSPLGRRFQTRDCFEYRCTILLPEERLPLQFEKIVGNGVILCINHKKEEACLIRYGDYAAAEAKQFEVLWQEALRCEQGVAECGEIPRAFSPDALAAQTSSRVPSISTRTLSSLREFFLSRKSLVCLGLLGVLAGGITLGLYRKSESVALMRLQDQARAIAAAAAVQFDPQNLAVLQSSKDIRRPEYEEAVYYLSQIRRQNPVIRYAYIMRPTEDSAHWAFVVDVDALDPTTKKDLNGDGALGDADAFSFPGDLYNVSGSSPSPREALRKPIAFDIITDQWGSWITGWAPINGEDGEARFILGVDIAATQTGNFTSAINPFISFIGLLVLFFLIRLTAFNRPLFLELWEALQLKSVLLVLITLCGLALIATYVLYLHTVSLNLERIREKVRAIAATGALEFEGDRLKELESLKDVHTDLYREVIQSLVRIQQSNEGVKYSYLLRPTEDPSMYAFIAASDGLDPEHPFDSNLDGSITDADELAYPGLLYDVSAIAVLKSGLPRMPVASEEPYRDQWGEFVSGYAPIRDREGAIVALLAIDREAGDIRVLSQETFMPVVAFLVIFSIFVLLRFWAFM